MAYSSRAIEKTVRYLLTAAGAGLVLGFTFGLGAAFGVYLIFGGLFNGS